MSSTITITLSGPAKEFVEAQAAARGHSSPDEFVASILEQMWTEAGQESLDVLLGEGLDSPSAPLDSSEWDSIRNEARAKLAGKKPA
jgi:hypothetical protein